AAVNYGADTTLTVKRDPTASFSRESFLRFPLPAFPGTLAGAQLQLLPVYANQPGTHAVALATNNNWSEAALTWNTKPGSGEALATWVPQAGVSVQVPVADAIAQNTLTDGFLSFRLYATNSTVDGKVDYASREGGSATAPQLSLFYTNAQPLSATQSFWVTVTAPQPPVLSAVEWAGGAFQMTVVGDSGPDYRVQASIDLRNWETLLATNSPAFPFVWKDADTNIFLQRFYRVQLGP
ncbi:MAG: CBM96 family carbohydrate-binding protein, partial [Verrucomicrobiota bacterium]